MGYITSNEALKKFRKLESRWSNETKLNQEILISVLHRLEQQREPLLNKIEKLERDLDYYIKEYPDQLKELEKAKAQHKKQ